jgi:hypothetical protein
MGLIQNLTPIVPPHHSIGRRAMLHQYETGGLTVAEAIIQIEFLQHTVRNYKTQDKRAGRRWNTETEEYVSSEWIENRREVQNNKCAICNCPFELCVHGNSVISNVAVDRIDNDLAHIVGNCELSCKRCNGGMPDLTTWHYHTTGL